MVSMETYVFWFYTSWFSILIPLYFIFRRFRLQTPTFRWLGYAFLFSFVCDFIGEIMFSLKAYPNLGGNLYNLFCILFISLFFYYALGKIHQRFFLIINAIYFSFSLFNYLFIQENNVSSYSSTLQALIIILFCLLFFYQLLVDLPTTRIHLLPLFWICSGWFISFSVKLIIYSVTQYLQSAVQDNLMAVWIVHNIFTFIANIFFGIGTWIRHRQLIST